MFIDWLVEANELFIIISFSVYNLKKTENNSMWNIL